MASLEVHDLVVRYGHVTAVQDVSLSLDEGQVAVVLGSNGAGKTSTLNALSGALKPAGGRIVYKGQDITGWSSHRVSRAGLVQVPEGRRIIGPLTVEENLKLGAYPKGSSGIEEGLKRSYALFPRLHERSQQRAGSLSGGEQQMLAIARALMSRPRLMLLDEPSLGLAPLVTRELFGALQTVEVEEGMTMLIVEQNANLVLRFADHAHVLETGEIAVSGDAEQLMGDEKMRRAYLGY
jgi:branched-chain amino acid transport system ATP-binding protein